MFKQLQVSVHTQTLTNASWGFCICWWSALYSQIDSCLINIYQCVWCASYTCKDTLCTLSHEPGSSGLQWRFNLKVAGFERMRSVVIKRKHSDSSLSCPLPPHPPHFHHKAIKVNRHFVLPLLSCCLSLSLFPRLFFFFHLLPLALRVLFELSFIAGTSRSIYSINIGSESL